MSHVVIFVGIIMLFTLLEDCHFSMNLNINLQREFICSPKNDKNALNYKLMKEANVNEATAQVIFQYLVTFLVFQNHHSFVGNETGEISCIT